jgi:glycosyltransferase involved in cell wall biosynthesis
MSAAGRSVHFRHEASGAESRSADTLRTEILLLTRRAPYPLDNGARVRTARLVAGLAAAFQTTLLTYAHHRRSADGAVSRAELEAALPGVEIVTVPGLGGGERLAQAASLAGSHSWEFGRYRRDPLGARLRQLVAERRPAIVHFDDLSVASFAPVLGPLNVFAPHDIEHCILAGNARAAGGVRRAFATLQSRKTEREERRVWQEVDLVLAVSQREAVVMRRRGARDVELCPNGTDRVAQLAAPRRGSGDPLRLLFVGSGSYHPNEVGLAWFIKQVYAPVTDVRPMTLDVVGQPPRRPAQAPGVVYHGLVPSVLPYYQRAHGVVVPVLQGSGTRLKIVEAMALGRPVISTPFGAEGLPIAPGEHYLAAEDAPSFIDELLRLADLLERPQDLEAMLERARLAVEPLFWETIVQDLVELYRYWIERTLPHQQPSPVLG